jgi:hypothetical protein
LVLAAAGTARNPVGATIAITQRPVWTPNAGREGQPDQRAVGERRGGGA